MLDMLIGLVFFVSVLGILALVLTGLGVVVNPPTNDAVRGVLDELGKDRSGED